MDENQDPPQWDSEDAVNDGRPEPSITPVQWSASEFISHQKNSSWYMIFGAVSAVTLFVVILVTGSIFSGLVIAFAFVVLGIFAARKPQTKHYELNADGILVENQFYQYEIFRSFSVVEEGAVSSIWLRPLRRFTPTMVIYFAPEDEDKIVDMLENFLPEEKQALDTFERLSRRMRF